MGSETPAEATPSTAASTPLSWLPPGWIVEDRLRTSGITAGTVDKYYIDPVSGRKFRSKKEVMFYLETGTPPRKKAKTAENSDPSSGSSGTSKSKKSGTALKASDLDFDFSNAPEIVTWVLTDADQDSWTPYMGGEQVPESEKKKWNAAFEFVTGQE